MTKMRMKRCRLKEKEGSDKEGRMGEMEIKEGRIRNT